MGACMTQKKGKHDKINTSIIGSSGTQMPRNFFCPITGQIMKNPVITQTGQSYQKDAIEKWFKTGSHIDPKTGVKLNSTKLIPNIDLRNAIRQFLYIKSQNQQQVDFLNLKQDLYLESNKRQKKLSKQHNPEIAVGISKCPNGHFLKQYSYGQRIGSGSYHYICDDCMRYNIQNDKQFYFCNKCNFDICMDCRKKNSRNKNVSQSSNRMRSFI